MAWTAALRLPCLLALVPALLGAQPAPEAPALQLLSAEAFVGVRYSARSLAIGDVDNDGWADIVTGQNLKFPGRATVWRNEAGRRFVGDLDLPLVPEQAFPGGGAVLGDMDNDGDLDLYVPIGAWIGAGRNLLFRNDEGTFLEVGGAAGVAAEQPSDNAIWLDVDADGLLDLFTGNPGCRVANCGAEFTVRNHLYRNRGDGTFEDVTAARGLDLELSASADEGYLAGGSNGGVAALDFTGDGLIDLYVAVFAAPNHLFVQRADGTFADVSQGDLADAGEAFGLAVGDVNGDGLPDILVAAGGSDTQDNRSPLLLNLGGGGFVDVSASVGLDRLGGTNALGVGFGDLDNDGDLDLAVADPPLIYLNDGHGLFTDVTAATGYPGAEPTYLTIAFGDLDDDGDLDLVCGGGQRFLVYRNAGRGNHFLRLSLEGVRSNRLGIGARLVARSGDLRQTRWLLGGVGYTQDEPVAHFGLGPRAVVDSLYVYWPSGLVDTLAGLATDQRLHLVEGSGRAVPVPPATTWSGADTVAVGQRAFLAVRPALLDPAAPVGQAWAVVDGAGGQASVPVQPRQGGTFEVGPLPADAIGPATVTFHLQQATDRGPRWMESRTLAWIVPDRDVVFLDDGLAAGWQVSAARATLGPSGVGPDGGATLVFAAPAATQPWDVTLQAPAATPLFGYRALRLVLRWTAATLPEGAKAALSLTYKLVPVDLLAEGYLQPGTSDWQVVELPLATGASDVMTQLKFRGTVGGRFEIADLRLVAATSPPPTAVVETRSAATPQTVALHPAFPNPFNPATTIAFDLAAPAPVDLALYDVAGQRVATLARGLRPAGSYALRWDGTDDAGRPLASGVYLVRLAAGDRVHTRKLLLLR